MWSAVVAVDTIAEYKKVVFRPSSSTDTVKIGDLVCYNSDLAADWKERTTNPVTGTFGAEGETAYAEGSQTYSARFLIVEKPSSSNLIHFAGVVVAIGSENGGDGDLLEIAVLREGAVVPVYTSANCVINSTVLGVASGSYTATAVTGDGDPLAIGVAVETKDRSGTNGLVWCRLYGKLGIGVESAYMLPTRAVATGDASGFRMELDSLYTSSGTTGPRTYGLYITGTRDAAYALSIGGCDDAALRISVTNEAINGEVYNFRGLNIRCANREDGVVGELSNTITAFVDGTSTLTAVIKALALEAYQESPDTPDEMGALDCCICREGGVATIEYGVQIRTRGTINTAVNTAIRITKDATDHGFINLFNIETDAVDFVSCVGNVTVTSADKAIPIVINGTTYYLIAVDGIPGV